MAASSNRPTKAERTSAAREAARKLHAEQAAAAKRKSLLVKLGVIGAMVLVIALVVMIVVQQRAADVPDSGPIPAGGNEYGGIVLVADGEGGTTVDPELTGGGTVDVNDAGTAEEDATPAPRGLDESADPAQLVVYVDVNCVHCSSFEQQYSDQLQEWVASGDVVLEYRNIAFLDGNSSTNFSSRGANALACVANEAPEAYMDYAAAVFGHYSEGEMTNSELAEMAADNGAEGLESCIDSMEYRPFAAYATTAASVDGVPGTPSTWLNGEEWDQNANPDLVAWVEETIG